MKTDSFGAGDTTLTQQIRMQKKIAEYIQNQLKENQVEGQMTMKEYIDPSTGSK